MTQRKSAAIKDAAKIKAAIEIPNEFENTPIDSDIPEDLKIIKSEIENKKNIPIDIIEENKKQSDIKPEKKASDSNNLSFLEDMKTSTHEDLNKKSSVYDRLDNVSKDEFNTNENANESEDSPEHKKQMAKIKASVIVEFVDVVFMILCLFLSKDFSEKAQIKFSLVEDRKKAIKTNAYLILLQSKKKQNPMSALIFLILFSYIPLLILAFMEKIKAKRKEEEEEKLNKMQMNFNQSNQAPNLEQSIFNKNTFDEEEKAKNKNGSIKKSDVSVLKNGSIKNNKTGQIYVRKQGRKPLWLSNYLKIYSL